MSQSLIDYDPDAPWIDHVYCVDKQLAVGDVVYEYGTISQSGATPSRAYEILKIEYVYGKPESRLPTDYRFYVEYENGELDVLERRAWNINRQRVVGGLKVITANLDRNTVYPVRDGYFWKAGR